VASGISVVLTRSLQAAVVEQVEQVETLVMALVVMAVLALTRITQLHSHHGYRQQELVQVDTLQVAVAEAHAQAEQQDLQGLVAVEQAL
jgi:hypothetical protein